MQESVSVRLVSDALEGQQVELFELSGRELLSTLFEFQVRVACADPSGLDERALLASPACLLFERAGHEVRRIHGVISDVTDSLLTESDHAAYTLSFVPRVFRLTLTQTSEVFMDQSVPDILRTKLERAGFGAKDFSFRLFAEYPKREYVVQYKETDLQFVSRLAEHVGIAFSFEHTDGRDVIVFTDRNDGFHSSEEGRSVPFRRRGERSGIFALQCATRRLPRRVVLRDYNYRTPDVSLQAIANVAVDGEGELVDYGAHFKTPEEGQFLANVRAEEVRSTGRVLRGESVETIGAGSRFTLEGHPRVDGDLLVLEVSHHAKQTALGSGTGADTGYSNTFRAIPFETTFRPPRVTPKPRVHGTVTGIVEAAQQGDYAELDAEGRYRVRSLFDMAESSHGKASRPVRMAQPHAGAGYGFHFPLRDGVEVILTCIDGDPDRPIIAGAVPNPITPTTVSAKNGTRNVIRTGGGNEINIDDTAGSERIKLTTPFGNTVFQLGAPNAPTPGAYLGTSEEVKVSSDGRVDIHSNKKVFVRSEGDAQVSGKTLTLTADEKIDAASPLIELTAKSGVGIYGGSELEGSADAVKLEGNATLSAESPMVLVKAGSTITLSAGAFVYLNAGAGVMIQAGGPIQVSAPVVQVNGAGEVNIKGGQIKLNA